MSDISEQEQTLVYNRTFARHSRLIGRLRLLVLLLIVLLVAALLIWPLTQAGQKQFKLTMHSTQKDDQGVFSPPSLIENEQSHMVKPRFYGLDKNKQPYSITADDAVQLTEHHFRLTQIAADILLSDDGWITLLSNSGLYDAEKKTLSLQGDVNMFTDQGYEFFTDSAHILHAEGRAEGNEQVIIQGPLGTLVAGGFTLEEQGSELFFDGGVQLSSANKEEATP